MQKRIKVALMSYAMDNRRGKGTALYTRKLIEGLLDDSRFDFYMVHFDEVSDPLYKKAKEIIMPKVSLPYGSRFVSQLLFFWKYRNDSFDIIHWFQPRIYPFYSFAPAKKIIVTMHGAGDITAPRYFVFSRLVFNIVLKYFHKSVDTVIADSLHAKSEIVKYYGFSESKVVSIYLGGGEDFKKIEKEETLIINKNKYNIPGPYILDISRFVPHKNIVTLIKAYDSLREKYPIHTEKLVIVGGSRQKNREEYVFKEKSPFTKDIIFIDFILGSDLNSIYSGAELFVFPSLDEGFGLPIIEAMASGTPVITSNLASLPEIAGDSAILVDPRSVSDIALKINNILTDDVLKKDMIKRGLERSKFFVWKNTAEETKKLYIELFNK